MSRKMPRFSHLLANRFIRISVLPIVGTGAVVARQMLSAGIETDHAEHANLQPSVSGHSLANRRCACGVPDEGRLGTSACPVGCGDRLD
jgi:hypothetical protein